MSKFADLQASVITALREDLAAGKMDPFDTLAYITILSDAEDSEDLLYLIDEFAYDVDSLKEILIREGEFETAELEKEIGAILSKILVDDPSKAKEVATYVKDEKPTLKELEEKFPVIKKYK